MRFEAEGFVPIDTTFPLTDNRIFLPITRDNSLGRIFGTVKDEQGNPLPGADILGSRTLSSFPTAAVILIWLSRSTSSGSRSGSRRIKRAISPGISKAPLFSM